MFFVSQQVRFEGRKATIIAVESTSYGRTRVEQTLVIRYRRWFSVWYAAVPSSKLVAV